MPITCSHKLHTNIVISRKNSLIKLISLLLRHFLKLLCSSRPLNVSLKGKSLQINGQFYKKVTSLNNKRRLSSKVERHTPMRTLVKLNYNNFDRRAFRRKICKIITFIFFKSRAELEQNWTSCSSLIKDDKTFKLIDFNVEWTKILH